jgi:hypothetical protein
MVLQEQMLSQDGRDKITDSVIGLPSGIAIIFQKGISISYNMELDETFLIFLTRDSTRRPKYIAQRGSVVPMRRSRAVVYDNAMRPRLLARGV